MTEEYILKLIGGGENISVEFKECRNRISAGIYETICAFLNRHGGDIFLGVSDDKNIIGIDEKSINRIKNELLTTLNNPLKLNPPCYLLPEEHTIDNKKIIRIFVPESSQVHRCSSKIYDRNEDGDFDITNNTNLVTELYIRKQNSYSENRVYPYVTIKNLRPDLIAKARKMASVQKTGHPWTYMSDNELVRSAQLYQKDYQSGKEGFTLAAVLLLGDDQVILSILPYHRTDALVRRMNTDRYDDRDDIRTNLIDSFERLISFSSKHLPDPFFLENMQRISLRDQIFREVIVNMLIHREFLNAYPAKLIIEKNRVLTENSNKPHGHGLIDPSVFSPFPKNPVIARFFKELGMADELGSGVRKLFKYCRHYSGGKEPQLLEEDIFKCIIPISGQVTEQVTGQVTEQVSADDEKSKRILEFCKTPKSLKEIMEFLGLKHREHIRSEIILPLIERGLIQLTMPEKPTSPKQKYYSQNIQKPNFIK